jgi:hypothetical protein
MSTTNESGDDMMMCCASCGIAQVDDIKKLNTCTACDLVQYCSDKCQREHRPKHDATCNERAAELREEMLFKQPESSHFGDCPICLLPLSIDTDKSIMMACCSKMICRGCNYANDLRHMKERRYPTCPFCRHPAPNSKKEADMNRMKRIEVNDPVAMCYMGDHRCEEGDYEGAIEYWTKAAELGDAIAHYQLSTMYMDGLGVVNDKKKELHHLTEAAISGHPEARYNLALIEGRNGRIDRAVKHLIIAASLGLDNSIEALKQGYVKGHVNKEDFAAALRAHQAAIDATKSPQREAAEEAQKKKIKWLL